jgi:CheY-like chemotaxis protein
MKRVLFVDDDQDLLEILARTVQRCQMGCEARFVASAELAVELLAGSPFDVVVTDWHMPGMDGAALLEHVRQKYPQVVRILFSSHGELSDQSRWTSLAHGCVAKPSSARALERVLTDACAVRGD